MRSFPLVLALIGCHGASRPPPSAQPVGEIPMNPASEVAKEAPLEARRLAAAVTDLARAPLDSGYRDESSALVALAESVRALSTTDMVTERVRSAAGKLTTATVSDPERVAAVSDALATAATLLTAKALSHGQPDHAAASMILEAAIEKLDGRRPLLEQRGRLLVALRAATNLVYIANGAERPFPLSDAPDRQWERPATFCHALEQVRARVRALAAAERLRARASAADVLLAIAEALSLDGETAVQVKPLSEIRIESLTLRRRNSMDGASGVKAALSKAIDICASAWNDPALTPWITSARRSTAAIERGFVDFQRAAIQDAARTVLDVLVVHARTSHHCTSPAPSDDGAP